MLEAVQVRMYYSLGVYIQFVPANNDQAPDNTGRLVF